MTTDYGQTSYARQARERKAIALETSLRLAGADSDAAAALDAAGRRAAERAAGVRPSSEETWQLVFTLMRSAEHRDLLTYCPTCRDRGVTAVEGHGGPCAPPKENDAPRSAEPRRPGPGYVT